jgi:hypothetical protein
LKDIAGERLLRNKCRLLIKKLHVQVSQILPDLFPTPASRAAQKLVLSVLEALIKELDEAANAEVVFEQLRILQSLVDQLDASSNAEISWPAVSYCDEIWSQFFPPSSQKRAQVFYSVTKDYNYYLRFFSEDLQRAVRLVMPNRVLVDLFSGPPIHLLLLPLLERTNLPLYANIGHELGHVLISTQVEVVQKYRNRLVARISSGFEKHRDLEASLGSHRSSVVRRLERMIESIFDEMFADMIGALIGGPAFLLSLYEMALSESEMRSSWKATFFVRDDSCSAYPSWVDRIKRVRSWISLDLFLNGFKHECNVVGLSSFDKFDDSVREAIESFVLTSEDTEFVILPERPGNDIITSFLREHIDLLTSEASQELNLARKWVAKRFPRVWGEVSPNRVAELVKRLASDVPPNIVPNENGFRGEPATFREILNAAAIYRFSLLASHEHTSLGERLAKLDRLTEKAMEVSYVQKEYNAWFTSSGGL